MEPLTIKASAFTPEILMDAESNTFRITGNSYPESPEMFFQPVYDWLKAYLFSHECKNEIQIHFEFNYYNTSSSKVIAKLFRLIENSPNAEDVNIFWHYDETDKDMLNAGRRYSSLYKIKFNLEPIV